MKKVRAVSAVFAIFPVFLLWAVHAVAGILISESIFVLFGLFAVFAAILFSQLSISSGAVVDLRSLQNAFKSAGTTIVLGSLSFALAGMLGGLFVISGALEVSKPESEVLAPLFNIDPIFASVGALIFSGIVALSGIYLASLATEKWGVTFWQSFTCFTVAMGSADIGMCIALSDTAFLSFSAQFSSYIPPVGSVLITRFIFR